MKKIFLTLAVFVMAICANAQKNQYFWYQGNLMMGNPIAQIDSVTFGEGEPVDTLHIMLPRTIIKTVYDTVYITIHDTVCPNENMYNGHKYVDLGLPSGLLWATCNVGADAVHQYGDSYSWGEVTPRTSYSAADYTYVHPNNALPLDSEHDAAAVNWRGKWRMPTRSEIAELINYCTYTPTYIEGTYGLLFTGPNEQSIFLPAAGCADGYYTLAKYGGRKSCSYWGSNVKTELFWTPNDGLIFGEESGSGAALRSIRPVVSSSDIKK
jgi:hypothetical protein